MNKVVRLIIAVAAVMGGVVILFDHESRWQTDHTLSAYDEDVTGNPLNSVAHRSEQLSPAERAAASHAFRSVKNSSICVNGVEVGTHCYCKNGWCGRGCNISKKEWSVFAGLPLIDGAVSNWNGFVSLPFKMRYETTGALLRRCRRIIEVGAYKTPFTEFANGPNLEYVTAIDPNVRARYVRNVQASVRGAGPVIRRQLAYRIKDYDFHELEEDCFVYIGLPDFSHIARDELAQLKEAMLSKRIVILEFGTQFKVGKHLFSLAEQLVVSNPLLKRRMCMRFNFDIPGNTFPLMNKRTHKPFKERQLCVFTTDDAVNDLSMVTPDLEDEVPDGADPVILDDSPVGFVASGPDVIRSGVVLREQQPDAVIESNVVGPITTWVQVDYAKLLSNMKFCFASNNDSTVKKIAVIRGNGYGHGTLTAAQAAVEAGFTAIGVDNVEEALAVRERGGVRLREQLLYAWRPFEGGDLSGSFADAGLDCGYKLRSVDIHVLSQPPLAAMAMCVSARTTVYLENIEGGRALCAATRQLASAEAFAYFRPTKVHIMILSNKQVREGTRFAVQIAEEMARCVLKPSEVESTGNPRLITIEGLSSRQGSMPALRQAANDIREATGIRIRALYAHNSEEVPRYVHNPPVDSGTVARVGGCLFGWEPKLPQLQNALQWLTRVSAVKVANPGDTFADGDTVLRSSMHVALIPVGSFLGSRVRHVSIHGVLCHVMGSGNSMSPALVNIEPLVSKSIAVHVGDLVTLRDAVRPGDGPLGSPVNPAEISGVIPRVVVGVPKNYWCARRLESQL